MTTSKNILITGVSTGIGYACARVFLDAGYAVFGSIRSNADAERLSQEFGGLFTPLVFDVTDHEAIDKAAAFLTGKIGKEGLACLINNAGVAIGGPMMHVSMEELRHQFEVNVVGLVKVTQAFLPLLGARDGHPTAPGKILNMSSVAGRIGMPFLGPYVGSKHALEGISHAMRRELVRYGIDVVIIGPGAIKTPIWGKGMDRHYAGTDFERPLQIFANTFIRSSVKHGLEADDLARRVLRIFEKKRPRVRYGIVPKVVMNWILPRLVPHRMMDRYLAKHLDLRR